MSGVRSYFLAVFGVSYTSLGIFEPTHTLNSLSPQLDDGQEALNTFKSAVTQLRPFDVIFMVRRLR